MTPDPSGAARAPQTLLEQVKTETLPECELQAGIAAEMGANGDAAVLLRAAEALGALVQAVEDQQREIVKLNELRAIDAEDSEQRIQNFLWAQERAEKAETLVAQLRADGQRLRLPIELMDDYGWSYDGRTHFQINVATIAGAKKLQAALEEAASLVDSSGDAP